MAGRFWSRFTVFLLLLQIIKNVRLSWGYSQKKEYPKIWGTTVETQDNITGFQDNITGFLFFNLCDLNIYICVYIIQYFNKWKMPRLACSRLLLLLLLCPSNCFHKLKNHAAFSKALELRRHLFRVLAKQTIFIAELLKKRFFRPYSG